MQQAFEQIILVARQALGAEILLGSTSPRNTQAIRMVEKLGFEKFTVTDREVIMRKMLNAPAANKLAD